MLNLLQAAALQTLVSKTWVVCEALFRVFLTLSHVNRHETGSSVCSRPATDGAHDTNDYAGFSSPVLSFCFLCMQFSPA